MKIITLLPVAMLAAINTQAKAFESQNQWTVPVYIEGTCLMPKPDLYLAKATATKMFAGARIGIDWRNGAPANSQLEREGAVSIRFLDRVPGDFLTDGVAFALPFEKFHITVLCSRLSWLNDQPRLRPAFLAHVLVHEITHILQAVDGHSEIGIMKSHWTEEDCREMVFKPLAFTPDDIQRIHTGMAKRAAVLASAPQ